MAEVDLPIKCRVLQIQRKALCATTRRTMFEESDMTVIAVSKTRPKEDVIEAYSANQRHFGENYVAELHAKATDPEVLELCPDIKWHFIGHLQRNKINRLLSVPNLYMIHTIDSIKLADSLDEAWGRLKKPNRLKVMVQVNVSEELTKGGIEKHELHIAVGHVINQCKNLEFHGIMSIGAAPCHEVDLRPNPDFKKMLDWKYAMCQAFNIEFDHLNLSMGMSDDFEHAIEMGSNYVRIGTAIFGPREKKTK